MNEDRPKLKVELEVPADTPIKLPAEAENVTIQKKEGLSASSVPTLMAEDILLAPLKPPPAVSPNSHSQSVEYKEYRVFMVGVALVVAGLLLWPIFGFWVSLIFALAGGGLVTFATFAHIK